MSAPKPNAEVDYVCWKTGRVLYTLPFFDPGLPKALTFSCGRPLPRGAHR